MRRRQNGFVTLTVTLMLMVLGTYGLYQSVEMSHYNVKRFQNVLLAKKSHWIAEGGLQCAFAINQTTVGDPQTRSYNACDDLVLGQSGDENRLTLAVTGQQIGTGSLYTLNSKVSEDNGPGQREVAKEVKVESVSPMPGIFKTSSNLILKGSYNFTPNYNDGECVTAVLKNQDNFFHTDDIPSSKLLVLDHDGYTMDQVPKEVTDSQLENINLTAAINNSASCKPGYQSFAQVGTNWPLAKDIVEEPSMDMFKDLFGVPKNQWETVRDTQFPTPIKAPAGERLIKDCAKQIGDAYAKGDRSFWIEGSCYLTNPGGDSSTLPFKFAGVEIPMSDSESAVIVVQDGSVFFNGQVGMSALLYQFKTDEKVSSEIAQDMIESCELANVCNASNVTAYENTAFSLRGSLYAFGGIAIDVEGMDFWIDGALVAEYNDKYWKDRLPSPTNTTVKWQQGTWRDFQ